MKIRKGFVSNSSSSNFVVIFPKVPKSVGDVKEILFGEAHFFESPWDWDADERPGYTTDEIAVTVWGDIQDQQPSQKDAIIDVIDDADAENLGFDEPQPAWPENYSDPKAMARFADEETIYNEAKAAYLEQWIEEYMAKNENRPIYLFTYADEDGHYFSVLEHGNIFRKLDYIKVSHH